MIRVLVVRNESDLEEALIEANKFLIFEGQGTALSGDDEILGIWISSDLDCSLQCSCQKVLASHESAGQADDAVDGLSLSVCRSTSLSGIWTLSSLDGPALLGIDGSPDRRKVAIHHISRSGRRADALLEPNNFLPVFNSELPEEALQFQLDELHREYPHLACTRVLCYDKALGIKQR